VNLPRLKASVSPRGHGPWQSPEYTDPVTGPTPAGLPASGILPAVHTIQAILQTLVPSPENAFAPQNFHELFYPVSFAALLFFIAAIVLYNVQVRKLHKHPPLVALQEWLLWTAICVYGLVMIEALFGFWFVTVVLTLVIGLSVFVWIRFFHFPPIIEGYNRQLARQRATAQTRAASKYVDPSSTVKARKTRRRRR